MTSHVFTTKPLLVKANIVHLSQAYARKPVSCSSLLEYVEYGLCMWLKTGTGANYFCNCLCQVLIIIAYDNKKACLLDFGDTLF